MSPRRSLDETRQMILAAGARLLVDAGLQVSVGTLSLLDASRAAGYTTAGSAYKIWETQDDFRIDLLRYIADSTADPNPTASGISEVLTDAQADAESRPPLDELIRTIAGADFERNAQPETAGRYVALWVASHQDRQLAGEIAASGDELLDRFARLYEAVAAAYDLEFVPPYDADLLATMLGSLVDGVAMRAGVHPERVPDDLMRPTGPDGERRPWNLYACAAQAIIEAFTRPRRGADEREGTR